MKYPNVATIKVEGVEELALQEDSIVLVVGPNDGGKSTFLRDVLGTTVKHGAARWIERMSWNLGTKDEYHAFLDLEFTGGRDDRFYQHISSGQELGALDVRQFYNTQKTGNAEFLIRLLDASTRITLANPTNSTDVIAKEVRHPYHRFFYDVGLEEEFSDKIESAFGVAFRANRTGSKSGG